MERARARSEGMCVGRGEGKQLVLVKQKIVWHQSLQENDFSKSLVSSDGSSVLLTGNCSIALISGKHKGV